MVKITAEQEEELITALTAGLTPYTIGRLYRNAARRDAGASVT
jgi:hypothetical protein